LVQHRGVADERLWLSGEAVKRLRDAGQQEPKRARFERYTQRGLVEIHDRRGRVCSHCTFKPGVAVCSKCLGTGGPRGEARCSACSGGGGSPCGPCDGTARVFGVTARRLSVGVGELEFVFLPALSPSLHEAITRLLLGAESLPPGFAFDIDRPIVTETASYRTHVPSGPPRIYGIDASGPLTDARAAFQRLSGGREVVDRAVECFALPFCMLRFGETTLALVSLEPTSIIALQGEPDA